MIKKEMKKPEVLAPVGSKEAFFSAIAAGCDALYLGGKSFGARAYANNFTYEELEELIDYAHLFNVKIYYTLNTIVKDIEFSELSETMNELTKLPIDAFILQDLGVYSFIKENYPDLVVHASTQMNLHSIKDVQVAKELGFDRVVLSRECSLSDIRKIKDRIDIEIEAFVHGALCYCYSGQCLMSSLYGGRSGNRGKCAQPCRMPYTIDNEKAYFLSPKDQMTLGIMPELIKAGIDSFKIEGRMKGPEYVFLATKLYKKYRDLSYKLIEEGREAEYMVEPKDVERLNQLFNRGHFTNGYYKRHNAKAMVSYTHGKNLGIKVGTLTKDKKLKLNFNYTIAKDDLLEIHIVKSLETLSFKLNQESKGLITVQNLYAPDQKMLDLSFMKKGEKIDIYRIRDTRLLDELSQMTKRQVPLHVSISAAIGRPLIVSCNGITISTEQQVDKASKRPMTEADFIKQFKKTKDTNYYVDSYDFNLGENIFIPIGAINQVRRELIEAIQLQSKNTYVFEGRSIVENKYLKQAKNPSEIASESKKSYSYNNFSILNRTFAQLQTSIKYAAILSGDDSKVIRILYLDMTDYTGLEVNGFLAKGKEAVAKAGKSSYIKIMLALPHVDFVDYNDILMKEIQDIDIINYDGFLVRTLGQLEMAKGMFENHEDKEIITDYNLHSFNKAAVNELLTIGASRTTLSMELNKTGTRDLRRIFNHQVESVIYGKTALMHSANCLYKTRYNKCDFSPKGHELILKDRKDVEQSVLCHCRYCYNSIYNHYPVYLLDELAEDNKKSKSENGFYRLDFLDETTEEVALILEQLLNLKKPFFNEKLHTRGHYKRGVQ